MADWHLGQEVVCVNTEWVNPLTEGEPRPVLGRIYTIEGIIPGIQDTCFYLAEVKSVTIWYAFHFRPVKKNKTDISAFRELLNPTPTKKKVLEDA
jgi:hypothetical protein